MKLFCPDFEQKRRTALVDRGALKTAILDLKKSPCSCCRLASGTQVHFSIAPEKKDTIFINIKELSDVNELAFIRSKIALLDEGVMQVFIPA